MALSGYAEKKGIVDNDRIYLRFEWSATQDIAGNYSTVNWALYLVSDGSQWGYVNASSQAAWIVNVNGARYDGTASLGLSVGQKKLLGNGSTQVPHNADGSKAFSFTFTQYFNIYWSGVLLGSHGGSGTATLDTIPRAASITAAPNFTDEENPTISYSNPAGSAASKLEVCISLTGGLDDIRYRDVPVNGSSYTFNLTEAERETLRKACTDANSRTVYFYIATTLGGVIHRKSVAKTLTIANAMPTLAPTVKDTNSATVQLTGSSAKLVRYYSDASYTFGASAKKHASITALRVTCGGKSGTAASGTLEDVESGSFVFQATESRGNTVTQTVTLPIVEYVHISCVMNVTTPTAEGACVLTANGTAFNGSFGATANALVVEYRYSTDGGTNWGNWQAMTAAKNGNAYTATANITGLDYRAAYTFQARARDALEVAETATKTVKAFPLFDWGENDLAFNVPVSADEGVTVKGFSPIFNQYDDAGYPGIIASPSDAVTFIRTPQQGLIPYEDGGSGQLGTVGWPFLEVHANKVYSHGAELAAHKILWSGAYHMNANQTISLSEAVSAQPNGIVLAWSAHDGGTTYDYDWHYQFIPKYHTMMHAGAGVTTCMSTVGFGHVGAKYVYVSDTSIRGHAANTEASTNNSVTYTSAYWVLRYVIGV